MQQYWALRSVPAEKEKKFIISLKFLLVSF
jgi:hypothetical protein